MSEGLANQPLAPACPARSRTARSGGVVLATPLPERISAALDATSWPDADVARRHVSSRQDSWRCSDLHGNVKSLKFIGEGHKR